MLRGMVQKMEKGQKMGRLIDADELTKEFEWLESQANDKDRVQDAMQRIKKAPTVDAVEVIRCKDCENCKVRWVQGIIGKAGKRYPIYYCYHWDYEVDSGPNQVNEDDFCSYGERRSDETD